VTFCSKRLFQPLIRSQFALHDVKTVQHHLKPLQFGNSFINRSYLTGGNCINAFNTQRSYNLVQTSLRHRLLSLRGLLLNTKTACRSLLTGPSKSFGIRGGTQQLRSFKLPRRTGNNEWETLMKLPISQRLKILIRKYWYIVLPLHGALCLSWFGLFYLTSMVLAKIGVETKQLVLFVNPYIQKSSIVPEYVKKLFDEDPATVGHWAVALLIYKLSTPVRYLSTIFGTFFVIRLLLRSGIMVKSSTELSTMVKGSYLNHAIRQNIRKRAETLKYRFKKPRNGK